tara:strand:- start:4374 stop:4985 length:612 start_codon:yes stop_codon:yes gene_type:complete
MINKVKGFTLIEILVAISIFSILSALAYGTLNQAIISSERLEKKITRMQSLQRGFSQINQDYIQLAKRSIRSEIGNTQIGAMTSNLANRYLIEFSRHGWPNQLGMNRGSIQRVAYDLIDSQLIRYNWNVLDKTYSNELIQNDLFDGIDKLQMLFLKNNNEWTDQWPPIDMTMEEGLLALPKAIRISITFNDIGEVDRIIEINT